MESALAAVALAGNILQFCGVARTLITTARSVKRAHDGAPKESVDLRAAVVDLEGWLSKLDTSAFKRNAANGARGSIDGSAPDARDLSSTTAFDSLERLVKSCRDIAIKLRDTLDKQCPKPGEAPGVFPSYLAAIKLMWGQKGIDEMKEQIHVLREEICARMLDVIRPVHPSSFHILTFADRAGRRQDVSSLTETFVKMTQQLEKHDDFSHESFESLKELISVSKEAVTSRCTEPRFHAREVASELRALRELLSARPSQDKDDTGPSDLQRSDTQLVFKRATRHNDFLEALTFRAMNEREDTIPEAHANTYEWLIEDPDESCQDGMPSPYHRAKNALRRDVIGCLKERGIDLSSQDYPFSFPEVPPHPTAHFQRWLLSGHGIFLIWGKPASGKSTAMKSLMHNEVLNSRLIKCLQRNSMGKKSLMFASCYFFRPGEPLQKSQLGFYQVLLHQILTQRKDLIDRIFTLREQAHIIARHDAFLKRESQSPVWTLNELRKALKAWRKEDLSTKLFLHVDGIDELSCHALEVVNLLEDLAALPNIQVLAAGRWRPEFDPWLSSGHGLDLSALNTLDITRFTLDRLCDRRFARSLALPRHFCELMQEVIVAAEGVFRWVDIVLTEVTRGTYVQESFEQLQLRLRRYPTELDSLYSHLFNSIESSHRKDAAFWLLAVKHQAQGGTARLTLLTLNELFSASKIDFNDAQCLLKLISQMADLWCRSFCYGLPPSCQSDRELFRQDCGPFQAQIESQCCHLFQFGKEKGGDRHIRFSHRTVLDFMLRGGRKLSVGEQGRILGRFPELAIIFSQDLLSDMRDLWSEAPLPQRLHSMIAIATSRVLEAFQTLGPSMGKLALRQLDGIAQHFFTPTRPVLFPSSVGWQLQLPEQFLHHIQSQHYSIGLHLIATAPITPFSATFRSLVDKACEPEEKSIIHLESFNFSYFRKGQDDFTISHRYFESYSPWFKQKALEFARTFFCKDDTAVSLDFEVSKRNICAEIEKMLCAWPTSAGVDTTCKSVSNDPEKVKYSSGALLKRIATVIDRGRSSLGPTFEVKSRIATLQASMRLSGAKAVVFREERPIEYSLSEEDIGTYIRERYKGYLEMIEAAEASIALKPIQRDEQTNGVRQRALSFVSYSSYSSLEHESSPEDEPSPEDD